MKKSILLLALSVFTYPSLQAHSDLGAPAKAVSKRLAQLAEDSGDLNWVSASDAQILNAVCTRKAPFTDAEMLQWMNTKDTAKMSTVVNGITFDNESIENIKSFTALTKVLDSTGGFDPKNQRNFRSNCRKVECAVKEILGKDIGLPLLFMQRKYGMNGSHISNHNSSSWRRSDLDVILLGLSDYPEGLFPVREDHPLMRYKRGQSLNDGGATIANAIIEVFDPWEGQSFAQKRSTIAHELGHVFARSTDLDVSPGWMEMGGWSKKENDGFTESVSSRHETLVSQYGMTNEMEDMAESVVAYRYNPELLKDASQDKYDLIKETIFDNVEYTSEEDCSRPNRLSHQLSKKTEEKISKWEPSESDVKFISKSCTGQVIKYLGFFNKVNLDSPDFELCYGKGLDALFTDFLKNEAAQNANAKYLAPMYRNVKLKVPDEKFKRILATTQTQHKNILKTEFMKQLTKNYDFIPENCNKDKFKYSYQTFRDVNFTAESNFSLKADYEQFIKNVCKQTAKKGTASPKKFSEAEISAQLDIMLQM